MDLDCRRKEGEQCGREGRGRGTVWEGGEREGRERVTVWVI